MMLSSQITINEVFTLPDRFIPVYFFGCKNGRGCLLLQFGSHWDRWPHTGASCQCI